MSDRPVVVVTGGGAGIGAAVAEELGRRGWFVVTLDPLVTLDGSAPAEAAEATTAERIVAAGGEARASSASVTDRDGVAALFAGLVDERGRLDAVVNAAGISRPTSFRTGTDEDWQAVVSVHLDGYRNVLAAALPIMAAAGRGRILGVTSGSGWRQADAGAYGCAKRAVASLTWQVGAAAPPGVAVNAMSPIAVTRMVTAALGRAPAGGSGSAATGGLALGTMPRPDELGPVAAHLVDPSFDAAAGQVLFVGGSEVALVAPPALLEVVRTDGDGSLPHLLEAVTVGALVPAAAAQAGGGGGTPRFGALADDDLPAPAVARVGVVADHPALSAALVAALARRGVEARAATEDEAAAFDGVVLARTARSTAGSADGWVGIVADHDGIVDAVLADAAQVRAVADRAVEAGTPLRLVVLDAAVTPAGRTRAQVSAQFARAAARATKGAVTALTVAVEDEPDVERLAEVAAHLLASPAAAELAGQELAVGPGWFGLRAHPRPGTSVVFGGPEVPDWFDEVLRQSR